MPYSKTAALPYTSNEDFEASGNIHAGDFIHFKGSHILFVEDNVINQKILQSILKKSGIGITIANHGEEALDILAKQERPIDLILMDIAMPVMDGYETTRQIRKDPDFDTMPIVTFTAFTQGKEIKKMFDIGANSHITKPLNIGQLYTVFSTYLPTEQRAVSFFEELKINGLDIMHGITLANDDEDLYKDSLFDFVLHYKETIHSMPKWIDNGNAKQIMATCSQMGIALNHIGAYELEDLVFRMKKIYLYKTEHRIEEFREQFPLKLNKLVHNIEKYLSAE
jgi:CheY-like chemotaxis protein